MGPDTLLAYDIVEFSMICQKEVQMIQSDRVCRISGQAHLPSETPAAVKLLGLN